MDKSVEENILIVDIKEKNINIKMMVFLCSIHVFSIFWVGKHLKKKTSIHSTELELS